MLRTTLLLLPLLAGCPALKNTRGKSLKRIEVTSIEATLLGSGSLCPGHSGPLVVTVHTGTGDALASMGAGDGEVGWSNFRFEGQTVSVDGDGIATLDPDARVSHPAPAVLTAHSVHHPGLSTQVSVSSRHDCAFAADLSGPSGADGPDGDNGMDGHDGVDELTSPSEAAPGGQGIDGQDGQDGRSGEAGRHGPSLSVQVELVRVEDRPLLQVQVEGSGPTQYHLVDPSAGSLYIAANGGHGGNGGRGGSGGTGGRGGSGVPQGSGGNGGNGGSGGEGADGGNGGSISVIADPDAQPWMGAIRFDNRGGLGGHPGSAGEAGLGGSVFSGGDEGLSGQLGQPGGRTGRSGEDGEEPSITWSELSALW